MPARLATLMVIGLVLLLGIGCGGGRADSGTGKQAAGGGERETRAKPGVPNGEKITVRQMADLTSAISPTQ